MPESENQGGDQGGETPPVENQGGAGGEPQGEGQGAPSEKFYDVPDGRKLTADQVFEEYGKLLPDYTRKSQELAELKKPREQQGNEDDPYAKFRDPNYQPKDWEEIIQAAEARSLARIEAKETDARKAQEERDNVAKQIDASVAEIKKSDKELDENDMFAYAAEKAKKGVQYTSVDALYDDYKAIREARKQGMSEAQRNMQNRANRDISAGSGGQGGGKAPVNLANLRGKSMIELAAEAVQRASK